LQGWQGWKALRPALGAVLNFKANATGGRSKE
jgi:hypothetical protein